MRIGLKVGKTPVFFNSFSTRVFRQIKNVNDPFRSVYNTVNLL